LRFLNVNIFGNLIEKSKKFLLFGEQCIKIVFTFAAEIETRKQFYVYRF